LEIELAEARRIEEEAARQAQLKIYEEELER
jgi:hypothetical protein